MTSSGEDICSPTELLPLTMGRIKQSLSAHRGILYHLSQASCPPHTPQLFYTPGSLLPILPWQLLLSRPSMGIVLAAHRTWTASEASILLWSHSPVAAPYPLYIPRVYVHQMHLVSQGEMSQWIQLFIACDVQRIFCRVLNTSLARPSVGSPLHYRMLITSHHVTWNYSAALS